jgi:predicted nucleotidyltransferase
MGVYGIPIKLFGSCANGIAIKNSDIDIAFDNSITNYFNLC